MRRTIALLLLLAGPAWGQAPTPPPEPAPKPIFPVATITAPASVPIGAPLVAYADQSVTSGRVSWILISPKVPFEVWDQPDHPGSLLLIRQPSPGVTYKIALVAYGNGNPSFAFDFADIPVGLLPNPPPDPNPTPDPAPNPPQPAPASVTGPLHAVLLYNEDDPSTAQLRVSGIRSQLSTLDCRWSVIPESSSALFGSFKPFLPASGVPAVLVMATVDGKSEIVERIEAPTSPASVTNVVKRLRGVK